MNNTKINTNRRSNDWQFKRVCIFIIVIISIFILIKVLT